MVVASLINGRILDQIRLNDMNLHCTIGIYPEEAVKTQPLRLNLALYLDTRTAASTGQLQQTVDYAFLARELSFILTHSRFRLLESAAEAVTSYILRPGPSDRPRALIEAVELEIIKPDALRGTAVPSLQIFRQAGEQAATTATDLIFAAPEAALVRFVMAPHTSSHLSFEGWKLFALMTSEAGLHCDGRSLGSGEELCAAQLEQSFFSNETESPRSITAVLHRDSQIWRPRPEGRSISPLETHYN